jgi:hypothetical protein
MSTKPDKPTIPDDTRDFEINRLQRAIHHLATAGQIASASAHKLRTERDAARLQVEQLTAAGAKAASEVEAKIVGTWRAAILCAVNAGQSATKDMGGVGAACVDTATQLIAAFADESVESIADMVAATPQAGRAA